DHEDLSSVLISLFLGQGRQGRDLNHRVVLEHGQDQGSAAQSYQPLQEPAQAVHAIEVGNQQQVIDQHLEEVKGGGPCPPDVGMRQVRNQDGQADPHDTYRQGITDQVGSLQLPDQGIPGEEKTKDDQEIVKVEILQPLHHFPRAQEQHGVEQDKKE